MQTSEKLWRQSPTTSFPILRPPVVAGNQRGFIKGRNMADNVIECEGAAFAYTQLHVRTLAGILLGFAQASPSLAHVWMWAVVDTLDVNDKLKYLIHALYIELCTTILYDNLELNIIDRSRHQAGMPA